MHFPSLLTAELFWCPQLKLSIIRTAANNDQMTLTGFFFLKIHENGVITLFSPNQQAL